MKTKLSDRLFSLVVWGLLAGLGSWVGCDFGTYSKRVQEIQNTTNTQPYSEAEPAQETEE